jgi:hypothetical protein
VVCTEEQPLTASAQGCRLPGKTGSRPVGNNLLRASTLSTSWLLAGPHRRSTPCGSVL